MLTVEKVRLLLAPYAPDLPSEVAESLLAYVNLLMRWNARTNLTAIRDAATLMQRQVGESLYAAGFLKPESTLLDFGSGAGFPGIPLALFMPQLHVTLAESQGKKAAFLREALRSLQLTNAEVFSGRVESLQGSCVFDTVIMRAVDHSAGMVPLAERRVAPGGRLIRYLGASDEDQIPGWTIERVQRVPLSEGRLVTWQR